MYHREKSRFYVQHLLLLARMLGSISILINNKKNIVMCEVITMTSKESLQIRNDNCVCKFFLFGGDLFEK